MGTQPSQDCTNFRSDRFMDLRVRIFASMSAIFVSAVARTAAAVAVPDMRSDSSSRTSSSEKPSCRGRLINLSRLTASGGYTRYQMPSVAALASVPAARNTEQPPDGVQLLLPGDRLYVMYVICRVPWLN